MDWDKLRAQPRPDQVGWLIVATSEKGDRGMTGLVVPYMTGGGVLEILDDACGPGGWKKLYRPGPSGGVICRISVYDDERGCWIDKEDGAANTEQEPVKGGLTQAFKRAARTWGVGKPLDAVRPQWVPVEKRGRSTVIVKQPQLPWAKATSSLKPGEWLDEDGVIHSPDENAAETPPDAVSGDQGIHTPDREGPVSSASPDEASATKSWEDALTPWEDVLTRYGISNRQVADYLLSTKNVPGSVRRVHQQQPRRVIEWAIDTWLKTRPEDGFDSTPEDARHRIAESIIASAARAFGYSS